MSTYKVNFPEDGKFDVKFQSLQVAGSKKGAVRYDLAQELTEEEQAQARGNIGAVSADEVTTATDGKITSPDTATVGDMLTVEEVDENGKPVKWKTAKPTTEVPESPPNPHKLTFSGAVEAEYDGSAEVEVEIPEAPDTSALEEAVNGKLSRASTELETIYCADYPWKIGYYGTDGHFNGAHYYRIAISDPKEGIWFPVESGRYYCFDTHSEYLFLIRAYNGVAGENFVSSLLILKRFAIVKIPDNVTHITVTLSSNGEVEESGSPTETELYNEMMAGNIKPTISALPYTAGSGVEISEDGVISFSGGGDGSDDGSDSSIVAGVQNWELLDEIDFATKDPTETPYEVTGLDGITDIYIEWKHVLNDSTLDSSCNLHINGNIACAGFLPARKSTCDFYQGYSVAHYNGLFWEARVSSGAIDARVAVSNQNGQYTYNNTLSVGIASTVQLMPYNNTYNPTSGIIKIYVSKGTALVGIPDTYTKAEIDTALDEVKESIPESEEVEHIANKVTELTESATDVQYPSAKAVYTKLAEVETALGSYITDVDTLIGDGAPVEPITSSNWELIASATLEASGNVKVTTDSEGAALNLKSAACRITGTFEGTPKSSCVRVQIGDYYAEVYPQSDNSVTIFAQAIYGEIPWAGVYNGSTVWKTNLADTYTMTDYTSSGGVGDAICNKAITKFELKNYQGNLVPAAGLKYELWGLRS